MLFPYAFRKAYLCKPTGGALLVQTSGTPETIQTGEFGLCLCPNGIEGNFIAAATTTTVKLVMGSWATKDQIAPFYGGLTAPVYSKVIDFRRVTRFIQSLATPAAQQIVSVGWDQTSGSTVGPVFYCGESYFLRLDLIGSPALRLLNHQLYVTLPAYGGCCGTDCSSGCTSTAVDAACIMLQWNDYMRYGTYNPGIGAPSMNSNAGEIPYLKQFFLPAVFVQNGSSKDQVYSALDLQAAQSGTYGTAAENAAVISAGAYTCNTSTPASVVASFQLTGAYVDTKYNNCTFTPSDYFEIEPIFCYASLMTSDFGPNQGNWSPCAFNTTINTSVPNMFTVLQAPVYPKGLGEQVVREIIQSERYRQNPFADSIYVDSFRFREIEDQSWILDNINRQGYYDVIGIAYNIYRPDNSQAVHDNDQYFDMIFMPYGTDATNFTTLFQACLTAVGSPVTLEKTANDGSGI
jgi:hypothetical protein